jgi:hypothetical protein
VVSQEADESTANEEHRLGGFDGFGGFVRLASSESTRPRGLEKARLRTATLCGGLSILTRADVSAVSKQENPQPVGAIADPNARKISPLDPLYPSHS